MMTKRTDKSITELYAAFAAAHAAASLIPEGAEERYDNAISELGKIAWKIVKVPATSVHEMLIKIAVAGWSVGADHKDLEDLANWQPGELLANEMTYCLATLREDLRTVGAAA